MWIDHFDLFLFDFDGILVDTEPLHCEAYRQVCKNWGVHWDWDVATYCTKAHGEALGVRKALALEYPELFQRQPNWEVLAAEKSKIYTDMLHSQPIQLM